jgi:hypothetical protein
MAKIAPRDLKPGDQVNLSVMLQVPGTIARTWETDGGKPMLALRTSAGGERVFPVSTIAFANTPDDDQEEAPDA